MEKKVMHQNSMTAPIVIFAFNRTTTLQRLIESLKKCPEAASSDVYVFVDGPRNDNEANKVQEVRDYVRSITGFRKVTHKFSDKNNGLGPSIIKGVSNVMANYDRAIILEDDLVIMPNFLTFMNKGLETYENIDKVFSICGYTNKIKIPDDYNYNAYFCTRSSSWGWATWKNRWESVDWNLSDWEKHKSNKNAFNKWGGSDCFSMLEGWKNGKNKSWAIRFCYSQFLQNRLSLFPVKSLIINDGFDGSGTNCKKWSRFKFDLMDESIIDFKFPNSIKINNKMFRQVKAYNGIPIRIWSKLMYYLNS